jgi:hypothetical protein
MPKAIEIEPNKTYVIETDQYTSRDQMQHLMDLWKEKTGSNCLILQGAKLAKEFTDAEEAVQRVREIHMPFWLDEPYCSECHSYEDDEKYASYPCPTIQALDGISNEA